MASVWTQAVFEDAGRNVMALKLEAKRQGRELTDDDIDVITRISLQRAELAQRIKAALKAGDEKQALRLMREYCGLEQTQ